MKTSQTCSNRFFAPLAALAFLTSGTVWAQSNYTITTILGNGNASTLNAPAGVAVDSAGDVFVAAAQGIFESSTAGVISMVAGGGTNFPGAGGPATSAQLNNPDGVAVDSSGNLYIAEYGNGPLMRVSGGIIYEQVTASNAYTDVAVDSTGNVYYSVNPGAVYKGSTLIAGTGSAGCSGSQIGDPAGIAVDGAGNVYIADSMCDVVWKVTTLGAKTVAAGMAGVAGFSGDGGQAASATLSAPHGVAVDSAGDLFIADTGNARVRMVNTGGIINTIAGAGTAGFSGDNGPALQAQLSSPWGVAVARGGVLYVGDSGNNRVRQLIPVSSGLSFVPMTPCRVVDTRFANGAFGSPSLTAGGTRTFNLPSGSCGVPSTASAYSLNVTVVPQGSLEYLTVWPAGQAQPYVSTLNATDGRTKANAAIIPAGTSGGVSAYATGATDLILDIDGYFVPNSNSGALSFYPVAPCRLADTRSSSYGALGSPSIGAGQTRTFPILSSSCGVPSSAQAYSLNFTAVPPGPLEYITTFPAGQSMPLASTLNAPTGTIVANAAIVPAGSNGSVNVFASAATDLVIDIDGYFAAPSGSGLSLYNLTPCRVLDTRNNGAPFSGEKDVNVVGSGCSAPSAAQAFVFNATVVPPASLEFLTLWPQGGSEPLVSTLNAADGAITSNMAIVPTSNGSIAAEPSSATQLILDIFGYFGH